MGIIRGILTLIGALVVAGLLFGFAKFGGKISQVQSLDPHAMGLYMNMFDKVLETGNSAKGMVRAVKLADDVSIDDVVEDMKSIAEENNMMQVGDTVMFDGSPIDNSGKKTKYTRILSYCSRTIARTFLNYSPEFGAFMPCRIMIRENDKGEKWLYTMALDLMIDGGKTLPPDMLKLANHVKDTMYKMMDEDKADDSK